MKEKIEFIGDRLKVLLHRSSLITALLVGVCTIILLIWILPQAYINSLGISDIKERITLENTSRGTLTQGLTGVFWFTTAFIGWRNLVATEEKQITERLNKAFEKLGNENIQVRSGAILELEGIFKDSDKDYEQVMQLLTSYVLTKSPYPPKDKADKDKADNKPFWKSALKKDKPPNTTDDLNIIPTIEKDIELAVTVICRNAKSYKQEKKSNLNLSNSNLHKIELKGANLKKFNLQGANLEQANLGGANLEDADLRGANLKEAILKGACLKGALLNCANLEDADLQEANLENAKLFNTNLKKANLKKANLKKANLPSAKFQEANLEEANLEEANLEEANLKKAYLKEANLKKAKKLTPKQVKEAKIWGKAKYDAEFSSELGL
jgi:uncharacterized protein YjbI with pentapeptide repeats